MRGQLNSTVPILHEAAACTLPTKVISLPAG
jgi:hypothetical protein